MILLPTSEISNHHKVISITMSSTSLSLLGNYEDIWNNGQDFFLEITPVQFPKSDLLNFYWIIFPEMMVAQFPEFGFLSRIHG